MERGWVHGGKAFREKLVMGHFATVSRAMKSYDQAEGEWLKEKRRILRFIGSFFDPSRRLDAVSLIA